MSEERKGKADETELVSTGPAAAKISGVAEVYEGGGLMPLSVDDIVGNKVAIKQLINQHNVECKMRSAAEGRLAKREGEIEYLKTSPFVAIGGGIASVIGSIVVGIGINQVGAKAPYGAPLLVLGGVMILTGSLLNILYPFARRWFNRGGW